MLSNWVARKDIWLPNFGSKHGKWSKADTKLLLVKKVNEISIEVVLAFTSMNALGGSLDVVHLPSVQITLGQPPNKDTNGELSAEGIAAELMSGETRIAWIGISRQCHVRAPYSKLSSLFFFFPLKHTTTSLFKMPPCKFFLVRQEPLLHQHLPAAGR